MAKRGLIFGALFALAACQPAVKPAPTPPMTPPPVRAQSKAGCAARAEATWLAGSKELTITAIADGKTCERAVATIVVRAADGQMLLANSYQTDQVMVLADQSTPDALAEALTQWIDPKASTMRTTGDLPAWPKGQPHPPGEFPFYPAAGLARGNYEALRAAKLAMFCYVQGIESLACEALQDGALVKVGVQSFPG